MASVFLSQTLTVSEKSLMPTSSMQALMTAASEAGLSKSSISSGELYSKVEALSSSLLLRCFTLKWSFVVRLTLHPIGF